MSFREPNPPPAELATAICAACYGGHCDCRDKDRRPCAAMEKSAAQVLFHLNITADQASDLIAGDSTVRRKSGPRRKRT